MRFFRIVFLLAFIVQISKAQSPPTTPIYEQTVTPPSPNTAALDRYIDCPVSYGTGIPNISIPIYVLKSPKLSVPISLSYHGGGIKVSDRSLSMGLGWSVNAGGSISRVVQDMPDEINVQGFRGYFSMVYPNENDPNVYFKELCLGNQIYNVYIDSAEKHDGQPDLFFYNFNGQGGKFIFRNNSASGMPPQAVTIPYSPIQISWKNNYSYFELTDHEGNIYQFGNNTYSTDTHQVLNADASTYPLVTTAWHLTKIISADRTDSIMFTYQAIAGSGSQTSPFSKSVVVSYGINAIPSINSGPGTAITSAGPSTRDVLIGVKEITSANGKVDFAYDSSGKLQVVSIYNNVNNTQTEIKSFNFFQSSFAMTSEGVYSTGQNGPSGIARPRLDSLQETGYINGIASTNPPYKFNYVSPDVPDIFSKSQDYWGFFNNKDNPDMLMIDCCGIVTNSPNYQISADYQKRAVDTAACKKGMLQSITYPTGGYTSFIFEPNQIYASIPSSNFIPEAVNNHISTFYLQPNDQVDGVSFTFTPNPKLQGQIKLDFTGAFQGAPSSTYMANNPEVILKDVTQNTTVADIVLNNLLAPNLQSSQESVTYYSLNLTDQYKLYFPTPGNITAVGQTTQFRLDAVLTQTLPDSVTTTFDSTTFFAGGLRIKQIQHNDGQGNTITKTYNYTIPYWNSSIFKGDYSTIANTLVRPKYYLEGPLYGTFPPGTVSAAPPGQYVSSMVYSEGFNVPIGSTNNSSVSYQQVEELMVASGSSLGKTVYTYNTAQDYISPQFPLLRFDMGYDRDQLLDTKVYKSAASGYTLIKDVTNTYNNVNDYPPTLPGADSIKYYLAYSDWDWQKAQAGSSGRLINADEDGAGSALSGTYHDALPVPGCPIYNYLFNHISPFYYHVVKQLLTKTVTTDYDSNGANPVTSETDYNYGNLAHIQPTRITVVNSDGKIKIDSMKYPLDYSFQQSCSPQAPLTTFNQQLATLQSQRSTAEQATKNLTITNATQYMYMVNTYQEAENTYNAAAATAVTQYNANLAQFQQCYAVVEASLPPTSKAIAYMQDRNFVTPKINTATTVNGNPTLRDSTNYELADVAQNIIRPQQVNIQVNNNPIEARAQFYAYDQAGNLIEQSKTGGPHSSYLWGYNKTYPVAQVDNAASNDIFYDGFEEGDGNSAVNDSKTGHYSYIGSYSKPLTGLDVGNYVLSYWQESAGVWTFQTSNIQVSAGNYTITIGSSNTQIDDVRFYPANAMMTTYTYDPLIGMTSSTDAKNETTYYEYDSFQRLMNIKDKDRNIVKNYQYHYQGQ